MRGDRRPVDLPRVFSLGAPLGCAGGRVLLLAAVLLAGIFAASCSFNYGESLAEDLADKTPDAVFIQFSHTIVQDNEPVLRLEAEKAELFDRKNTVHLYGVTFTELRAGRVLAGGSAEEAVLKTDTEDAEFFGAVNLRSEEEGITIQTGYLSWNAQDRILQSKTGQFTEIEKDDGSRIQGSGFRADARRKGISFTEQVEGVLVRPAPEGEE